MFIIIQLFYTVDNKAIARKSYTTQQPQKAPAAADNYF